MAANAVAALTRLPDAKPIAYVTPSGAAALRECLLRVAYGGNPELRKEVPSSPAARLGTACHEILEAAAAGRIPKSGGADWPEFDQVWDAAIRQQAEEAAAHPFEKHWPAPNRWPGYAMRKLRTKRLARQLAVAAPAARAGQAPPATLQEHWQEALGGQLRGRADMIRRQPEHVIEDYKTGVIYEDGTGELRQSYKEQLLLYAVLEEAESGSWPTSAKIVPLEGEPVAFEIDPKDAQDVAAGAVDNLNRYNDARGGDPASLATPAPRHCRYCPYSVRCPEFWATAEEDWTSEGVVAACGTVTGAEQSRFGTVDVDLVAEAGSCGPGPLQIHALDPLQLPADIEICRGDALAVTGLRLDGADRSANATPRTRVAVAR